MVYLKLRLVMQPIAQKYIFFLNLQILDVNLYQKVYF